LEDAHQKRERIETSLLANPSGSLCVHARRRWYTFEEKDMEKKIGSEALRPNPALEPFKVLVGQWQTIGSHPYLPDIPLHGRTTFDWLEGGAFLIMHSEIDNPTFPRGIAIFGSDDAAKTYFMLTFDERGVSRKYDVTMTGNQLKWWRDEPSFSQRFTMTIEDNGNKMESQGEMSREGATWEKDLALTYVRLR
jgi:hypothetical protein